MSKPLKPIFFSFAVLLQILQFFNNADAQTLDLRVTIAGTRAEVTGKIQDTKNAGGVTNFSLADSVAGQSGLAARHSGITLFDDQGREVAYRTLASGEFLAERTFASFRFRSELRPANLTAMAHVSWIADGRGVIAGADLFPRLTVKMPVRMRLELPSGWRSSDSAESIEFADPASAIVFIGNSFRSMPAVGANARVIVDGDFMFRDSEAAAIAGEILGAYRIVFGSEPTSPPTVILVRYPKETRFGRWEAETRGSTVLIASADMPISTPSVQRLHEQLRHELFHLWMPNGLALTGNYDWFFEGFALYQSLRTGVALNRIRFDDFLDTLGRAYDADSMLSVRRSLLEASRDRWSGANTQVYARGMLVAFMIDVTLLARSKGKRSAGTLLNDVWTNHRIGKPEADGNEAILKLIERDPELKAISARYIRGSEPIDWRTELASAGIESRTENLLTRLAVTPKPNGRQKDLLDKLGYNNWRNFNKSSK